VLIDGSDRYIGLSAGHILKQSHDYTVYNMSGRQVGELISEASSTQSGPAPFHDLIGRVILKSATDLIPGEAPQDFSNKPILPGLPLYWAASDGSTIQFRTIGRGGEVAFSANPYEPPSYFRAPVVLELAAESDRGPGAGDAGSPLFDGDGNVVALLISSDGERFYAAAIEEYAAAHGLRPPGLGRLLPAPLLPDDAEKDRHSIEGEIAVGNIYAGLELRTAVHSDPGGENVPADLLHDLKELVYER
jgi:hypothetical protein